ncbi:MAG: anthranilate synthase component I family protein, partial [Sphingobacteriaceae bacterium]
YIATANQIKQHISRGDIYVTNFCQEFYADDAAIDPLDTFFKLNSISPNPFSCFFKLRDKFILCASPERFLAKRGTQLISQPIKGTAKRSIDEHEDKQNKDSLKLHTKELQENVMIVDLVRNDLTRSARQGTVKTEELFGIYSFAQVHQMISTVVCELDEQITAVQAVKNTFPMGSMTGAPKLSSMKLMEHYERSKRGVYSGAMGYFSPDNDFDFNVVIRTLLYNAENGYLSFQTGSAITFHADAEQEYEECLLKAKAILEVLGLPST